MKFDNYSQAWNGSHMFAPLYRLISDAGLLATLPMLVLFLLLQRYVIKGFSSGLKG